MNREAFFQLIDKFLAGNTTAEEEQLLYNYFESFQQSSKWNEQELGPQDAMEQKLMKQLSQALINKTGSHKAGVFRIGKKWMMAASFLAVFIGGYLVWALLNKFHGLSAMKEVVTGTQERKQVRLGDGTAIWLEPGSRLKYPEKFSDSVREITFTGEAFFDVAKNPDRPFIIHTGTVRTRVLGTSFTVKAYDSLSQEVAVVTGRVLVQADNKTIAGIQPVMVIPNQKASWNSKDRRMEKIQLSSTSYYAQRRYGKFIYQGESVASVLDDIQHQYNVQIHYDSSMRACPFYGDFDIRQPVGKVLNSLATALNAQLTKDYTQNTYRLLGGGCF